MVALDIPLPVAPIRLTEIKLAHLKYKRTGFFLTNGELYQVVPEPATTLIVTVSLMVVNLSRRCDR